jgi:hypothetical protein
LTGVSRLPDVERHGEGGVFRIAFACKCGAPRLSAAMAPDCRSAKRGDIEGIVHSALISHHVIVHSREAAEGVALASNDAMRLREAVTVAK